MLLSLVCGLVSAGAVQPRGIDYPATYAGQSAWCAASQSWSVSVGAPAGTCQVKESAGGGSHYFLWTQAPGWNFSGSAFTDYQPENPCQGMSPQHIYSRGKVLEGSSSCVRGPRQDDGSQAMCGVNISPAAPPVWNPGSGGRWETYMLVSPTGAICGEGSGDNPGLISGPPGGPTVPPADIAPPLPDPMPPDNPDPPKLCGGKSCYDPGKDQYCAIVGGAQVCVSGPDARGGSGGCAVSGNAALCAGSPEAPPAPTPPITDPATQVQGNQIVTHANPVTGGSMPVNVVVFAQSGTSVESGQTPSDNGPAPPSSSSPPASSYAGGGNCTSPPLCSGDAVMCGIARQTWISGCRAKKDAEQAHKDLAGDGTDAGFDASVHAHSDSDVWGQGTNTGDPIGDAANSGNYDTTGMGFSSACPLHDMVVPLPGGRSFAIEFSKGCAVGAWIKALVLAFATFAAVRITAGGTS